MGTKTELQPKDWDSGQIAMLRKLKRYCTQIQGGVPKDPSGRPLAIPNVGYLMDTGLLVPLDELVGNGNLDVYLPISYLEGPPTVYGVPIWEQLEGEPVQYYNLFREYRSLMDDKGLRSIFKLGQATGIPMQNLELLRQTYMWQERVHAFDVYRKAEREYMLQHYRDEIQDKHRKTASTLFEKCTNYIINNEQLLSPKSALEWAKLAVELERISVGLNPDKPGTIVDNGPSSVVNIQNNVHHDARSISTGSISEDKERLKQLVNVMNNIGIIKPEIEQEVIEVDSEPSEH